MSHALDANGASGKIERQNASVSTIGETSIYDVFSKSRKRVILAWISGTVILLPFSDTIYLPAIHTIARDLNTTDALVNLTIATYLLFVGISSLVWGVISDRWGRNLPIRIGLLFFTIISVGCIFARDIVVLFVLRTLQGSAISVKMVVGQAIIADIFPSRQRGWAMGIFFVPVLLGVVIGPIFGGVLTYFFNWRSTFVCQASLSLIILLVYIIIIPETHPYLVMKKLPDQRIIEQQEIEKPKLSNPFLSIVYLTRPSIFSFILAASTAFGSIVINQSMLAITLAEKPYDYNELKIGLSNIPLSIAEVIGCLIGGRVSDKADSIFKKERVENRLIPGTISFFLIPLGLAAYGWAFQFQSSVAVPLVTASVVAFGQAFYRPGVYSYLTIKEQQHAATVASANNFLNFVLAAIGVAVAVPVIDAIGIGLFFTIIAGINVVAIFISIVFMLYKRRSSAEASSEAAS